MTEPTPPASPNLTLPQPGAGPGSVQPGGGKKKTRLALWITLAVLGLLIAGGVFWYFYNFHASIRPVRLNEPEIQVVKQKIEAIESAGEAGSSAASGSPGNLPDDAMVEGKRVRVLSPEEEREALRQEREDRRTVVLTQREINGMLNHNTDLGQRLKFDLKPGYIDIEYIQPIPEDIKLIGGQTWRFSLDVSINKIPGGKLELKFQDISVGGIPLPAAWLEIVGIRKNEDLIELIKKEMPVFEKFEEGIDYVDISSGEMRIRLAE